MKAKLATLALVAASVTAGQAATLQFTTSPTAASILNDAVGAPLGGAAWGVIVDTTGNGFGDYSGMVLFGSILESGFLAGSDDYLFLSANPSFANDGPLKGAALQSIVDYAADPAVDGGQSYSLMWFQGTDAGAEIGNSTFGLATATGSLPASNGDTISPVEFQGNNGNADQLIVGIPEPSVTLLGALGLLGLLRRRR